MEGNGDRTIKILIGVIIGLSAIILFSGIFYILNMQSKIAKLETEQEEQLRRQVETQNMASIQSVQPVQPQPNEKTETQKQSQTNTTQTQKTNSSQNKKSNTQSQPSVKRGSVYATKSTSDLVNVRAEPIMNSEIIERLPDDIALRYLSSKGNWYYVVYNVRGYNEYGYIHKSQLAR